MQDDRPNRLSAPDTQRHDWTPEEKSKLRDIAAKSLRKQQLRALFPGRSLSAIKLKLYQTRRELELPKRGKTSNLRPRLIKLTVLPKDTPALEDNWLPRFRVKAERSNERFMAALLALAA